LALSLRIPTTWQESVKTGTQSDQACRNCPAGNVK
jgi:hypothetical protein